MGNIKESVALKLKRRGLESDKPNAGAIRSYFNVVGSEDIKHIIVERVASFYPMIAVDILKEESNPRLYFTDIANGIKYCKFNKNEISDIDRINIILLCYCIGEVGLGNKFNATFPRSSPIHRSRFVFYYVPNILKLNHEDMLKAVNSVIDNISVSRVSREMIVLYIESIPGHDYVSWQKDIGQLVERSINLGRFSWVNAIRKNIGSYLFDPLFAPTYEEFSRLFTGNDFQCYKQKLNYCIEHYYEQYDLFDKLRTDLGSETKLQETFTLSTYLYEYSLANREFSSFFHNTTVLETKRLAQIYSKIDDYNVLAAAVWKAQEHCIKSGDDIIFLNNCIASFNPYNPGNVKPVQANKGECFSEMWKWSENGCFQNVNEDYLSLAIVAERYTLQQVISVYLNSYLKHTISFDDFLRQMNEKYTEHEINKALSEFVLAALFARQDNELTIRLLDLKSDFSIRHFENIVIKRGEELILPIKATYVPPRAITVSLIASQTNQTGSAAAFIETLKKELPSGKYSNKSEVTKNSDISVSELDVCLKELIDLLKTYRPGIQRQFLRLFSFNAIFQQHITSTVIDINDYSVLFRHEDLIYDYLDYLLRRLNARDVTEMFMFSIFRVIVPLERFYGLIKKYNKSESLRILGRKFYLVSKDSADYHIINFRVEKNVAINGAYSGPGFRAITEITKTEIVCDEQMPYLMLSYIDGERSLIEIFNMLSYKPKDSYPMIAEFKRKYPDYSVYYSEKNANYIYKLMNKAVFKQRNYPGTIIKFISILGRLNPYYSSSGYVYDSPHTKIFRYIVNDKYSIPTLRAIVRNCKTMSSALYIFTETWLCHSVSFVDFADLCFSSGTMDCSDCSRTFSVCGGEFRNTDGRMQFKPEGIQFSNTSEWIECSDDVQKESIPDISVTIKNRTIELRAVKK